MEDARQRNDKKLIDISLAKKEETIPASEKGAKAAWKGFASQTLYIAQRLMFLDDESDFFPEKVEDLLVKKDGIPIKSVQVKNITSDLTLSHFDPQSSDSFFRRSLLLKKGKQQFAVVDCFFRCIGKRITRGKK